MGTDGLWDLISNQEAVDLVLGWIVENEDVHDCNYAHLLAEEAYRRYRVPRCACVSRVCAYACIFAMFVCRL